MEVVAFASARVSIVIIFESHERAHDNSAWYQFELHVYSYIPFWCEGDVGNIILIMAGKVEFFRDFARDVLVHSFSARTLSMPTCPSHAFFV